jgi:hypothetical protein
MSINSVRHWCPTRTSDHQNQSRNLQLPTGSATRTPHRNVAHNSQKKTLVDTSRDVGSDIFEVTELKANEIIEAIFNGEI